jgi:trans-aconitate methyltransferase
VADLGCGAGNLTPRADLTLAGGGVIQVEQARRRCATAAQLSPHPHLRFVRAILPPGKQSNPWTALFQCSVAVGARPSHTYSTAGRLHTSRHFGSANAYNFDEPTHGVGRTAYTGTVTILGPRKQQYFVQTPAWNANTLNNLGCRWTSGKLSLPRAHGSERRGQWVKGTALRPTLSKLNEEQQRSFSRLAKNARCISEISWHPVPVPPALSRHAVISGKYRCKVLEKAQTPERTIFYSLAHRRILLFQSRVKSWCLRSLLVPLQSMKSALPSGIPPTSSLVQT